jgi:hypothetical protein
MKRHTIRSTRSAMLILVGILRGLLLGGLPGQAQHETGPPQIINLYADGPQPPQTDVAAGAAVVWVSHLAHTNLVVVTVTFAEGHHVAQATTPLQGYNGFVLEGHALRGRMEGQWRQSRAAVSDPGHIHLHPRSAPPDRHHRGA